MCGPTSDAHGDGMNSHIAFGDPSATMLQMYLDSTMQRTRKDLRRSQRRYQRGAKLRKILG